MSKGKELAKNTIIITVGKICTQFISFFLLPLYTAYLATGDYGAVELINTYIALLIPLVTLQLEQSVFRFLIDVRSDEDKKSAIITNTFKKTTIQAIFYFIIFMVVAQFLNIPYKYFLGTNVVVCMFSSICLQITRGLGKTKTYTIGSMITGGITVILNFVLIVVFKMNAKAILISSLVANILCIAYLMISLKIYKYIIIGKKVDDKISREMYKYSLPMIPNAISWWIVNVSDRTIISLVLGLSFNGIYSIANKFASIYILIYNLFNLSWTESAAMHINDKDSKDFFTDTINNMFTLFTSACIGIISVLPIIFDWVVRGGYKDAYNYMPILLIASLFNVVIGLYSVIYVAKKQTKQLASTAIWAAIINISVNILFIKQIGLYAAALSTAIAYFVMMIVRYWDVKKYMNIKLKFSNIAYATIGICIATLVYYLKNKYLIIANLIVAIILAVLFNMKFIKSSVKSITELLKRKMTN